jgi:hypothetical protein
MRPWVFLNDELPERDYSTFNMKKSSLLLSAIVVLFGACSRSGGVSNDGSKLYRIMSDGKLSHEYEYNLNGTIARQAMYGIQARKFAEVTYFYDASNKLVKTESYSDVSSSISAQQLVYHYSDYKYRADGKLSEETAYTKKGNTYEFASKTLFTYDGLGRVVSRLKVSMDDKPFNLFKYEYDGNGNVVVQESYQYDANSPRLGSKSTYEHDNKKNPYFNISVIPFSVNTNNITRHFFTNYNVTPTATVTTETIYKSYNAAGYPVEVIEYGTNNYIYQYK